MNHEITNKIVGWNTSQAGAVATNVIIQTEATKEPQKVKKRETAITGTTYKIKPPQAEHALYLTINNNPDGSPYEIFINSQSVDHFQWVTALTRVISAVFRSGNDTELAVNELRSVFDPQGGYFNKGEYMASLVAEIGSVIQKHMKVSLGVEDVEIAVIPNGLLCKKCNTLSIIKKEGCMECMNCSDSKCS